MEEMVKSMAEKLISAAIYSGVQAVAWLDTISPPEKRIEQINHLLIALKNSTDEAVAWFNETFPAAGDKVSFFLSAAKYFGSQAVAWLDTVSPPEKRSEQLNHLYIGLKNSSGEAVAWLHKTLPAAEDKVSCWMETVKISGVEAVTSFVEKNFPPEKISQWVHVGKPYAVAAVVLVVLYQVCGCCLGGGGKGMKMMKAPGRNLRIPRSGFANNPKAYFADLRRRS